MAEGSLLSVAGMEECEAHGAKLNRDFSERSAVFEGAAVAKKFICATWLDDADVTIDVGKLKSHGMMGMSCAAKICSARSPAR